MTRKGLFRKAQAFGLFRAFSEEKRLMEKHLPSIQLDASYSNSTVWSKTIQIREHEVPSPPDTQNLISASPASSSPQVRRPEIRSLDSSVQTPVSQYSIPGSFPETTVPTPSPLVATQEPAQACPRTLSPRVNPTETLFYPAPLQKQGRLRRFLHANIPSEEPPVPPRALMSWAQVREKLPGQGLAAPDVPDDEFWESVRMRIHLPPVNPPAPPQWRSFRNIFNMNGPIPGPPPPVPPPPAPQDWQGLFGPPPPPPPPMANGPLVPTDAPWSEWPVNYAFTVLFFACLKLSRCGFSAIWDVITMIYQQVVADDLKEREMEVRRRFMGPPWGAPPPPQW